MAGDENPVLGEHRGERVVDIKAAPSYARGDGVHDDSAALAGALESVKANSTAEVPIGVIFPIGVYRLARGGFDITRVKPNQ